MYVLNTDLVCSHSADALRHGVLLVVGGATLDLNGHTVTCSTRGWGIQVTGATLTNGTVRGCGSAVVVGNGIVKNMTLIDNYGGVVMTGEDSAGANLIVGSIATGGNIGFLVEEAHDNTFIDNHAIGNVGFGFYLSDSNGQANLIGNRALENVGAGFAADGRGIQLVANIAKRNGGPGFNLDGLGQARVNYNVSKANRGDGFSISANGCAGCYVTVMSNSAIGNVGIGFHACQPILWVRG
jgi:parallel beta-helix repeat protein